VPLHKRCRTVESALNKYEGCTISLRLRCIRGISWRAQRRRRRRRETLSPKSFKLIRDKTIGKIVRSHILRTKIITQHNLCINDMTMTFCYLVYINCGI
jgi:hypothetical protein